MANELGVPLDAERELSGSIADQGLQCLADLQTGLDALTSTAPMRDEPRQSGDEAKCTRAKTSEPLPADDQQFAETLSTEAGPLLGGRYQILRPHAEGGLGKVWVARDIELNREVALKEIKPRGAND